MKTNRTALRSVSQTYRAFASAALVALLFGTAQAGRVVIVEGNDANPGITSRMHVEATYAHINYLAKGYTVERLSNATGPVTKAAVLQALNHPANNAFFFNGHGTGTTTPPPGAFAPGLVLDVGGGAGGVLTPADIPAASSAQMLHVELQACGQKLPAWDAEFPSTGASGVDAWDRAITGDQVLADIRFGSPDRIPQKAPARGEADAGPGGPFPPKGTDPRFAGAIFATPSHSAIPGVRRRHDIWMELGFTLPPPVAVAFGSKTFNIQVTNGVDTAVLHGLSVSGGTAVAESLTGYALPDFSLSFDPGAFASVMANIDTLPSLQAAGRVTIVANATPLPANVLIQGAAGAYFGMFNLRPPCFADLNFDWVGNTADLTILLGNFGTAVAPFTGGDLDGNGVVNTADLTIFLGGFGCG